MMNNIKVAKQLLKIARELTVPDNSQGVWKLINKDVKHFVQEMKIDIENIEKERDLLKEFHDFTYNRWKIYIINQKNLKDYIEKCIDNRYYERY